MRFKYDSDKYRIIITQDSGKTTTITARRQLDNIINTLNKILEANNCYTIRVNEATQQLYLCKETACYFRESYICNERKEQRLRAIFRTFKACVQETYEDLRDK